MKRIDKTNKCIVENEKKRKVSENNDHLSTSGSGIASNQSSDNEENQENSELENGEAEIKSEVRVMYFLLFTLQWSQPMLVIDFL